MIAAKTSCISVLLQQCAGFIFYIYIYEFYQFLLSLGFEPITIVPCSIILQIM